MSLAGGRLEATINPMLRLCEDVLSNHGAMELPALPRMIFVVHGSVSIGERTLRDEEAVGGESAIMLKAGSAGATVWRWELITREADFGRPPPGSGIVSHEKLAVMLATVPAGALLSSRRQRRLPARRLRLSAPASSTASAASSRAASASIPMAAPLHTGRAAPGMRPGLTAVFAQAADRPTRFIRVMVLPRALISGKARSNI